MAINIKALTATQALIQIATKNQRELQKVSIQIATSNKNQDFKGFAEQGTVEKFISLSESFVNIESFVRSNDVILSRVNTMEQTIEQIQDIAADMAQLFALRRNAASGEDIGMSIQAKSALDNIAGKLNVRFDGRYLFSGTKTNTKPVQSPQSTNLDSSNQPTTNYYSGDSSKPSIKINDSQTLEYGITADDIGFQELMGAINLAIEGDANNNDETLEKAVAMINSSIANLAAVRASVISSRQTLVETNSVHRNVSILIGENLIGVSQTDIVEATTRMSEIEATLQATYISFTKLNGLRLSNFLN